MKTSILCLFCLIALVLAVDRTYFIAADEVIWDYAPLNYDGFTGMLFNTTNNDMSTMSSSIWTVASLNRIGKVYKKVVYREYTDSSFSTLKERTRDWLHLGLLGPVIRAVVDDTLRVTFKNNWVRPLSMHPHGVFYDKNNEGVPQGETAINMTGSNGNSVMPGSRWTYVWQVPERAGPASADVSSILWIYHSHVNEVMDVNMGLVGPIIITRKGAADTSGKPIGVDREFVIMMTIIDENMSWLLEQNMNISGIDQMNNSIVTDPEFVSSNEKHAVNGFLYSNLPNLTMNIGESVRWYLFSVGDEVDLHGVHWHGHTLTHDGHRVDVMELIPATMRTLDMTPDNVGKWLLHCHTNHHIMAGMSAVYTVGNSSNTNTGTTSDGNSINNSTRNNSLKVASATVATLVLQLTFLAFLVFH